ncbi:MAG: hypothetical protein GF334_04490 [Candidatus Altiarchaeales archaeon]|nr:hypothetical protein [Candidatus Altiarchaeales archaeon]
MNENWLQKIIEALVLANLVQPFDKQRALDVCKEKVKDEMHVVWDVEDVMTQAGNDLVEITEDDAREILASLHRNHDADVGINWDVISTAIARYFQER